jgi:hypothetical protein
MQILHKCEHLHKQGRKMIQFSFLKVFDIHNLQYVGSRKAYFPWVLLHTNKAHMHGMRWQLLVHS